MENHLQAEIASAIQKLLRDAERQVKAINDELDTHSAQCLQALAA